MPRRPRARMRERPQSGPPVALLREVAVEPGEVRPPSLRSLRRAVDDGAARILVLAVLDPASRGEKHPATQRDLDEEHPVFVDRELALLLEAADVAHGGEAQQR